MNELTIINEQKVLGKDFKVYGTFENPLFLAKDVAEWIEHSKVSMMLDSVDDDEKIKKICEVNNSYPTSFKARKTQEMWFLTENGLYEVLMLSRKPIAKEFKKEVKKILHQLRTKGGYITEKGVGAILDNPDYLMELINESGKRLVEMRKRAEIAERQVNIQNDLIICQSETIKEQQPKVEVYDELVDREYCKNFRDTATYLGLKQKEFMNILKYKYIYKVGDEYRAYAEYKKYFALKAFVHGDIKGNQLLVNMEGLKYFKSLSLVNMLATIQE